MTVEKKTAFKRARNPMPASVEAALNEHGLLEAYQARPPYQRNDYLGWISRAKRDATRQKRIDQMLAELKEGGKYMNMAWSGGRSQT
ncbi:YdeI/OmpD-associated family protein [Stenotrophomonas sp. MYb238]|uniref:YdeI/OmpD-associated family protein n=1 Tax=Stenotrophomonas sp. MYb238 TaxID=2040281 RepID=UPI001884BACC|nr:YdeI/OmpD-associated family protein [Stenotrophomonas sp. MYb238]